MSGPIVVDASALLAVLKGENGWEKVVRILRSDAGNLFIHGNNAFEVVHKMVLWGVDEDEAWKFVTLHGIQKIDDVGGMIGRRAVRLKIKSPFLSLGDCFAIALAEELSGSVLTSDAMFSKAQTGAEVILFR